MSDDILNRIDSTIAEYVDWDGHSEDSVRQTSNGTTIDTRRYNARQPPISRGIVQIQTTDGDWVTIGHIGETPAERAQRQRAAEEAARAAAASFAAAWEAWVEAIRPTYEAIRDAMAAVTAQQRNTFRRVLPPRVINPTRNRVPHQTNRYRGGHRG